MSDLATAEGILIEACKLTKLSPDMLRSRNRAHAIARPRQACALVIRRRTKWSTTQIAKFLGLMDHTTILHASRKAEDLIEFEPSFRRLVDALMAAEPKMPMSSSFLGASMEFEAPPPTRMQIKRAVVKRVKPPKPALERIKGDGLYFTMDEDGHCRDGRMFKRKLIAGSKALAEAILSARRAAA